MRNPQLKYAGLIVAIFGGLLTASSLYMGTMPWFNNELSDYSTSIIIGIILLVSGLLTWIFVFE